jgi:hypothetical protein
MIGAAEAFEAVPTTASAAIAKAIDTFFIGFLPSKTRQNRRSRLNLGKGHAQ